MDTKELDKIDIDRLGLAYCQMNGFIWDEIFGEPPKDWNSPYKDNKTRHKDPHFQECFRYLESRLTSRQQSMYWWTIQLKRSYQEWAEWYDKHGHDPDYVVKKENKNYE